MFNYAAIDSTFGVGWGFNYKVEKARRFEIKKENTIRWWLFVVALYFGFYKHLQNVKPAHKNSKYD